MAYLTMHFNSIQLKMNTTITVVLPDSTRIGTVPLSKCKVLYLLHGLSDDSTSILRYSQIEYFAQKYNVVIVMPSVGRSFYCDNINAQHYFQYVSKELPEYMKLVFNLSGKREDNFVAGISMGGYGALKVALSQAEHFSVGASFSGLLSFDVPKEMFAKHIEEFPFLLSDVDKTLNGQDNLRNLLPNALNTNLKLFLSCGSSDDLLPTNYLFREECNKLGVDCQLIVKEGTHNWEFWNEELRAFLHYFIGGSSDAE